MRTIRVYRLDIEYPAGSLAWGWEPADWDRGGDFGPFEGTEFRWPHERLFLSRSGANKRAKLLRGYGATVTLLPSLPIEWPAGAEAQS